MASLVAELEKYGIYLTKKHLFSNSFMGDVRNDQ